jgi:hypothetical protein
MNSKILWYEWQKGQEDIFQKRSDTQHKSRPYYHTFLKHVHWLHLLASIRQWIRKRGLIAKLLIISVEYKLLHCFTFSINFVYIFVKNKNKNKLLILGEKRSPRLSDHAHQKGGLKWCYIGCYQILPLLHGKPAWFTWCSTFATESQITVLLVILE